MFTNEERLCRFSVGEDRQCSCLQLSHLTRKLILDTHKRRSNFTTSVVRLRICTLIHTEYATGENYINIISTTTANVRGQLDVIGKTTSNMMGFALEFLVQRLLNRHSESNLQRLAYVHMI